MTSLSRPPIPSETLPVEMRARWAVGIVRGFREGQAMDRKTLDTAIRWLEELLEKKG